MEEICRKCGKKADVTCICNNKIPFCFEHMNTHLETSEGKHKTINLKILQADFYKKCKLNLEKIKQAKNDLISRSKHMIEAILQITKIQLSNILNNYGQVKRILKNKDFSDKVFQTVEEIGKIKLKKYELNKFNEIASTYLCVFINENEILSSKCKNEILPPKCNIVEPIRETPKKVEENEAI